VAPELHLWTYQFAAAREFFHAVRLQGVAMQRYAALAFSLLLFCPFNAPAQDVVPNLSGVWLLNPQNSTGSAHPPEEMRVKIEQNGSDFTATFRVRNNGTVETNVERLRVGSGNNANEIHGAPMISKADWDGATLVVDSVAKFGDQELRMNDRWTLSPDRQTLKFVERHQFGAEPKATEVAYVFDRQPDESWQTPQSTQPAEQVYRNIEMLKGVPAERVPLIMGMFSRVLGVQCTHCHVAGAMEKGDKPTFAKARRMFQMRNWIARNAKIDSTCWTCHRGHVVPEAGSQIDPNLWPAELNLSAEQGAEPAAKVFKNLKFFNSTAADLKSAMLFMSASLGVQCSNCHVAGSWESDDKPAKDTARRMLAMVRDTRREFTEIRIGCPTCHHGARKPEMAPPTGQ